jgi:hypothetical protein
LKKGCMGFKYNSKLRLGLGPTYFFKHEDRHEDYLL